MLDWASGWQRFTPGLSEPLPQPKGIGDPDTRAAKPWPTSFDSPNPSLSRKALVTSHQEGRSSPETGKSELPPQPIGLKRRSADYLNGTGLAGLSLSLHSALARRSRVSLKANRVQPTSEAPSTCHKSTSKRQSDGGGGSLLNHGWTLINTDAKAEIFFTRRVLAGGSACA